MMNLDLILILSNIRKKKRMNKIKEVLKRKGIKQKWLSKELGKSYNMVNCYVRKIPQPRIEDLYRIALILNVEAKELLVDNKIIIK